LFDGVPIGLYRTSPDGRILDANLALVHMLGYPDRKSLKAINAADTYANAEDRQSWQALIKQEGVLSNFEKQLCCYGGSKIWVEENTRAVYGPEGQVLSYEGSFQDITKRKRAEEALKQSEEKYRTILENIEEGYYEVDIAGNFTFFNDSTYRILGYPKEGLIGINDRQYTDQENAKRLFQAYNKVYRTGMPDKGYDYEIIRKDGTKRYIEVSIALQKDSSGKTIGFKGIVRDITERKWAEEEREKLIRDLQETLSKVKTLSGMLPICSSCKKIRDDKGYWKQIEVYIRDHSETEFTHSICPECFKKLYPDFDDEEQ
jgi:PAS domain S-box-containing protein